MDIRQRRKVARRFTYRRFTYRPVPHECRFPVLQTDYQVFTRLNDRKRRLDMCPNCFTSIAMAVGGAGSAIIMVAAGLRLRTVRAPDIAHSNTEETAS